MPEGSEGLVISIEPSQGHLQDLRIDPSILRVLDLEGGEGVLLLDVRDVGAF